MPKKHVMKLPSWMSAAMRALTAVRHARGEPPWPSAMRSAVRATAM